MNAELVALIVFILIITIFLVIKRKNIELQKILFPVFYFILYKTKIGIATMEKIALKYKRAIGFLSYVGIVVGFVGMAAISFLLCWNLYKAVINPSAIPAVGLVLPVKVKGTFYVPFFYWIISILVIATVHEFSHGIVARKIGLKIKSSGFAFLAILLPIIPAAFVEPDEKKIKTKPFKQQLAMFAAGPFSNILMGAVILGIFLLAAPPIVERVYDFQGVQILDVTNDSPAFNAGISANETITGVDGKNVTYTEDFISFMSNKSSGDRVMLTTDKNNYDIALSKNPKNNQSYLGVSVMQKAEFNKNLVEKTGTFVPRAAIWIIGLLYWLYLLNLGIGIFNLVPVGPIDGGRMLQLVFRKVLKKKGDKYFKAISMIMLLVIVANLLIGFAK
jgi:membrane-associated protease RseP (regulator of RpoE activity)